MSVRISTLVWDAEFPSAAAKLIALKLADCANDDGASIWPARSTIEKQTGLGPTAVKDWLAAMDRAGLTVVDRRGDGRPGSKTTVRRFNLDLLRALGDGSARWRGAGHDLSIDRDGHHGGPLGGPGREAAPVTKRPPRGRVAAPPGPRGGPKPSREPSLTRPQSASARSGLEELIQAVMTPERSRVLADLFRPLLAELQLVAPDPVSALGALADEAATLPATDLAAALAALRAERAANVKPGDVRRALAAVRKSSKAANPMPRANPEAVNAVSQLRIERGTKRWDHWLAAVPQERRPEIEAASVIIASAWWPKPGARMYAPVTIELGAAA
jgi:hypothetical protein